MAKGDMPNAVAGAGFNPAINGNVGPGMGNPAGYQQIMNPQGPQDNFMSPNQGGQIYQGYQGGQVGGSIGPSQGALGNMAQGSFGRQGNPWMNAAQMMGNYGRMMGMGQQQGGQQAGPNWQQARAMNNQMQGNQQGAGSKQWG